MDNLCGNDKSKNTKTDFEESSPSQALRSGTRLEEFVIERVLGSGGFGITYLAKDSRLGRQVVIKENLPVQFCWREPSSLTVRPRHSQGEDAESFAWSLENFEKEAALLTSLDHPGIVRVLRSFEAFGTAFFVMPFVEGKPLDEEIRDRREQGSAFSEEELVGLLRRMLDALEYLHARGIYHRDIKPGNILITHEGVPVLIDFGSARQRLSERSLTVIESPGYTPFEQLQSRGKIGPWSDLYALGGTLYKAITGETPPKATDRIMEDPMLSLSERPELVGRYSRNLLTSIDRAMVARINDRLRSSAEWWDAIRKFSKNFEPSAPQPVVTAIAAEEDPIAVVTVVPQSGTSRQASLRTTGRTTGVQTAKPSLVRPVAKPKPATLPPSSAKKKKLQVTLGGVIALTLLLVGYLIFTKQRDASQRERLQTLATGDPPTGNADDIQFALAFLDRPDITPAQQTQANKILVNLTGPGVEEELIRQAKAKPGSYLAFRMIGFLAGRNSRNTVTLVIDQLSAFPEEKERFSLLGNLHHLIQSEDLDPLLELLGQSKSASVNGCLERLILEAVQAGNNPGLVDRLLSRVDNAQKEERLSLLRILANLGGPKVLTKLQSAFDGQDQSLQFDVTAALLIWPTVDAMPLLEKVITTTKNPPLKNIATRAYVRLSSLPGTVPMSERIAVWKKSLRWLGNSPDARLVLAAALDYPTAETQAFLKETESLAPLAKLAKDASSTLAKTIQTAPVLDDGGKLPASESSIRGGRSSLQLVGNPPAFSNWESPETYFAWHFKVETEGSYQVELIQAYNDTVPSEFEVVIGTTSLPGKTTGTGSWTDFKPIRANGKITLEAGKVNTLFLRAKGTVQPRMMDILAIRLTMS